MVSSGIFSLFISTLFQEADQTVLLAEDGAEALGCGADAGDDDWGFDAGLDKQIE